MKKIKIYLTMIFISSVLYSCSDDKMDNIDKDPNVLSDVPANLIIPQVVTQSAVGLTTTDLAWYSSVFVEFSAGSFAQMKDADRGQTTNSANIVSNNWNDVYKNMFDLKLIIKKCSAGGSEPSNDVTRGIAQILLAYNLGLATDIWGDIPYVKAFDPVANPFPTFDSQQNLYTEIQSLLNKGIASLKSENGGPGDKDFLYAGDPTLWTKAAYAFKARYYNHLSKKNPVYQDSALSCIDKAFAGNTESMIFNKYENTSIGSNLWQQYQEDRNDLSVGMTFYHFLDSLADPRLTVLIGKNNEGNIVAAPNGLAEDDNDGGLYSRPSELLVTNTAPTPVITFIELKFIEAECKYNKGDKIGAYDAFTAGINSHFTSLGLDATTYLTTLHDATNITLSDILLQKYISFYCYGSIEAFNDWRRTGFPTISNPNFNTQKVGRFPYGTEEVASNPNINKDLTCWDKVWWAK